MLNSVKLTGKNRLRFTAFSLVMLLWLALLPGFVQAQATPVTTVSSQAISRQPLILKLDDGYTTKAELNLPAAPSANRLPAVLLIGGSGQTDMNGAGPVPAGAPVFQIYKEMLDNLAGQGFIVYKYNKRGLDTGGKILDQARSDQRTNEVLVKDAAAALRQFLTDPRVDPDRVFLLGHSQGSLIAAQVAQLFPGQVKGLILTGPITSWKAAFDYQLVDRFIEVAHRADQDRDGKLGSQELTGALNRDQAIFANFRDIQLLETAVLPYFSRPAPGQIGPLKSGLPVDKDKDGQLSIEQELKPVLLDQRATFLNRPVILENSGESGAALQSLQDGPQLEEILFPLNLPVFFQHSLEDERFPLEPVQALATGLNAASVPAVLNVYPGLTHAFIPGSLLYNLREKNQAPETGRVVPARLLNDQAAWLHNRLKGLPASPPAATPGPALQGPAAPGLFDLSSLLLKLLQLLLKS